MCTGIFESVATFNILFSARLVFVSFSKIVTWFCLCSMFGLDSFYLWKNTVFSMHFIEWIECTVISSVVSIFLLNKIDGGKVDYRFQSIVVHNIEFSHTQMPIVHAVMYSAFFVSRSNICQKNDLLSIYLHFSQIFSMRANWNFIWAIFCWILLCPCDFVG